MNDAGHEVSQGEDGIGGDIKRGDVRGDVGIT